MLLLPLPPPPPPLPGFDDRREGFPPPRPPSEENFHAAWIAI
jgi:hypothetical protein